MSKTRRGVRNGTGPHKASRRKVGRRAAAGVACPRKRRRKK